MRFNLGIIGTGLALRRLHWPILQKMPGAFRVVALANRTRAKAEQFAREMGEPKVYEDYRDLLDDSGVEVVLTAVPVQLNAQIMVDAIHAGKHVMAEKPIATTPSEAREVLRACKDSRKVLAIAENFRYREDVIKAHEIIASGEIGEVYCFQMATEFDMLAETRRPWFEKGTWRPRPISDTGIHIISSLRDILGEVKELYAQVLQTSPATEGPDTILVQLTMCNDAIGHYLACYSAKVMKEAVFDFKAFGKKGCLQLTDGEVVWSRAAGAPPLSYRPEGYDRGYTNQWRNFHRAICGEEPLVSTPGQAYRDLLVIDAVLRSASKGEKVQVACSEEDFK